MTINTSELHLVKQGFHLAAKTRILKSMNITVRPFPPDHQEFLFQLYASTRQHEISAFGWNPAQEEAFLRMQFKAQQQWYETAYAEANHQLIVVDEQPAGRILTWRECDGIRLVDIALLSEYRNRGIGAQLLRDLISKSENERLPMRLQVLKSNPACRLYQRLGFVKTGDDGMYYQMEKIAASST
jgi:ribosomal protein S18 acetylase RimI-like enzyme